MGLVHIFLFLNVKDGPSRFRMASFYAVRRDFCWNCCFLVMFSLFCIPCAAMPHWRTHSAAAHARIYTHTNRQIVCIVILTSASSAYIDVMLCADDWWCDLISSFSSCWWRTPLCCWPPPTSLAKHHGTAWPFPPLCCVAFSSVSPTLYLHSFCFEIALFQMFWCSVLIIKKMSLDALIN